MAPAGELPGAGGGLTSSVTIAIHFNSRPRATGHRVLARKPMTARASSSRNGTTHGTNREHMVRTRSHGVWRCR
jgi:hypothetical protein